MLLCERLIAHWQRPACPPFYSSSHRPGLLAWRDMAGSLFGLADHSLCHAIKQRFMKCILTSFPIQPVSTYKCGLRGDRSDHYAWAVGLDWTRSLAAPQRWQSGRYYREQLASSLFKCPLCNVKRQDHSTNLTGSGTSGVLSAGGARPVRTFAT